MDQLISRDIIAAKRTKRILLGSGLVVLLLIAIWLLRTSIRSSVAAKDITTAVVERGDVENTISASGELLPEFEGLITSPIQSSVTSVNLDAGSPVKAGQSILSLDKSAAQTEYEKLRFEFESKNNELRKLRLELDKSFYDIQSGNRIKQLRISSLEADVEHARRLYKAGGGTRESIEQAELNLKVARLEKQQLENEISSRQQSMKVQMDEARIATSIQVAALQALERKLRSANITAGRDGVVTWVNKAIGAAVREGEPLARIADLSSFKVQGSISDNYGDQIHNGMPAIIRINDTQVRGRVVNIAPSVQNNIVAFDIRLDQRSHPAYRPNMKVDVYLVTDARKGVMRVSNGPAFKGSSVQDVFLVKEGKGLKRTVHTGLSNFDYVEIMDNMKPGDIVVTSDMSAFKNSAEVTIKR